MLSNNHKRMSGRIKRKPKVESSESDCSSVDEYIPPRTTSLSRRASSQIVRGTKKEVENQVSKSFEASDEDEDEYESSDDDTIAKRKRGKNPKQIAKKSTPKIKTKPITEKVNADKEESSTRACHAKKKPPQPKKKCKKEIEEVSCDDSSNIDEEDEQNVKSTGRRKLSKKNTSEFELRKSEYIDHRNEWLSRPITKYTAMYSFPVLIRKKKVTAALLSNLWGGERLSIFTWINSLYRLENPDEEPHGNSRIEISVPLAAYEIRNSYCGSMPLFLRPYEGQIVKPLSDHSSETLNTGKDVDLYLNTAGPIWCLAYAPNHTGAVRTSDYQNYLAVGTSRIGWLDAADGQKTLAGTCEVGDDVPYNYGAKHRSPNLLQIWGLKTKNSEANNNRKSASRNSAGTSTISANTSCEAAASLQYCVGLQSRGPVWKVAWSSWNPFGVEEGKEEIEGEGYGEDAAAHAAEDREVYETSQNFLGILAVVCGDGSCLVMVLPKSPDSSIPSSSSSSSSNSSASASSSSSTSASSSSSCSPAERIPVLSENSVCRWEVSVPRESIGSKYSGTLTCGH